MSDMFSEEMKKEFVKLIDKQLKLSKISEVLDTHRDVYLGIEKIMKELNERIVDVEDITNDLESDLDDVIKRSDMEELVGKTMLKLIPDFNKKIAMEVKKHLVAIAEYVIKNFKEKE